MTEKQVTLTEQELSDLVASAVLVGWKLGESGHGQPEVRLEWLDGSAAKVVVDAPHSE